MTGRQYTYSEARDAANYIARSLLSMGLRKGDVVALVAPNYPESILTFLGILEADLIITTVNPYYTAGESIFQHLTRASYQSPAFTRNTDVVACYNTVV